MARPNKEPWKEECPYHPQWGWDWVSDDIQTGRVLVCHIPSWVGSITACRKSDCGSPQGSAQAYTAPVHLGLPRKSHVFGEEGDSRSHPGVLGVDQLV